MKIYNNFIHSTSINFPPMRGIDHLSPFIGDIHVCLHWFWLDDWKLEINIAVCFCNLKVPLLINFMPPFQPDQIICFCLF